MTLIGNQLEYWVFKTDGGWLAVAGSPQGLKAVTLPQATRQRALAILPVDLATANFSLQHFEDLSSRLSLYFGGRRVEFTDELDIEAGKPFQRRVWLAARLIPYGQTRSYRWLAAKLGNPEAVRAVGQALGRNPLAIVVPCHRVIKTKGSLGGFSGGVAVKRYLLDLEASACRE